MTEPLQVNVWIQDDEGHQQIVPVQLGEAVLGRLQGCEVFLDERNVSRRHARLFKDHSGAVFVEDLVSYNGLFVNGQRVVGLVEIFEGDVIKIGDYQITLHGLGLRTRHPGEDTERTDPHILMPFPHETTDPDLKPPSKWAEIGAEDTAVVRVSGHKADAVQEPYVVCLNTEWAGAKHVLKEGDTTFGRGEQNTVALNHRSLSRVHAKITCAEGVCTLVDMGSANGTLVNGEEYARTTLRHGDVIECGHVKWGFVGAGARDVPSWEAPEKKSKKSFWMGVSFKHMVYASLSVLAVVLAAGWGMRTWLLSRQGALPSESLPEVPLVPVVDADEWFQKAKQHMQNRAWKEALFYTEKALQAEPQHKEAQALSVLAEREIQAQTSYEVVQKAVKAQQWSEAWNASQEVFPQSVYHAEIQSMYSQIRKGLLDERIQLTKQAIAQRHWDDAESYLEEIEGLDKNEPQLGVLRRALVQAKQPSSAVPVSSSPSSKPAVSPPVVAPVPSPPAPQPVVVPPVVESPDAKKLYAQGVGLLQSGDAVQAANILLQCVAANKGFGLCYRALGITYARMGDAVKAARYYRLYLSVDPQAKDAAQVKQLLEQYEAQQ